MLQSRKPHRPLHYFCSSGATETCNFDSCYSATSHSPAATGSSGFHILGSCFPPSCSSTTMQLSGPNSQTFSAYNPRTTGLSHHSIPASPLWAFPALAAAKFRLLPNSPTAFLICQDTREPSPHPLPQKLPDLKSQPSPTSLPQPNNVEPWQP